jgi:hypothetical protein
LRDFSHEPHTTAVPLSNYIGIYVYNLKGKNIPTHKDEITMVLSDKIEKNAIEK